MPQNRSTEDQEQMGSSSSSSESPPPYTRAQLEFLQGQNIRFTKIGYQAIVFNPASKAHPPPAVVARLERHIAEAKRKIAGWMAYYDAKDRDAMMARDMGGLKLGTPNQGVPGPADTDGQAPGDTAIGVADDDQGVLGTADMSPEARYYAPDALKATSLDWIEFDVPERHPQVPSYRPLPLWTPPYDWTPSPAAPKKALWERGINSPNQISVPYAPATDLSRPPYCPTTFTPVAVHPPGSSIYGADPAEHPTPAPASLSSSPIPVYERKQEASQTTTSTQNPNDGDNTYHMNSRPIATIDTYAQSQDPGQVRCVQASAGYGADEDQEKMSRPALANADQSGVYKEIGASSDAGVGTSVDRA